MESKRIRKLGKKREVQLKIERGSTRLDGFPQIFLDSRKGEEVQSFEVSSLHLCTFA